MEVSGTCTDGYFHARAEFNHPLPAGKSRPLIRSSSSAGRGGTRSGAEASAIAEALERYCSTWQGRERTLVARAKDVNGIFPQSILLYSDKQMSAPDADFVPERCPPDFPIAWSKARSISTGSTQFVPAGCCFLHYPFLDEPRFACPDTNGCAIAANLESAILTALLELIERDAVAIWWYNRIRRPALHWDEIRDPLVLDTRRELMRHGQILNVLDLTHDLGIPVYAAVSSSGNGRGIHFGTAAHVDAAAALRAAVGELSQVWFWSRQGRAAKEITDWLERGCAEDHPQVIPDGFTHVSNADTADNAASQLKLCLLSLDRAGLAAFYVDLTRPEIGLPAARVIVPGLRHFWRRFASGRLFTVPTAMGWLPEERTESELDPVEFVL